METNLSNELESLAQKIESNTANLEDYYRYETLLSDGGLPHDYIYSYLYSAGFKTWEEFIDARLQNPKDRNNGSLIGGILGLGLGMRLKGVLLK